MAGSFQWHSSRKGIANPKGDRFLEMAPSTSLLGGDLLDFGADGKLKKISSQTALPQYVCAADITSTANGCEAPQTLDAGIGDFIWKNYFTPKLNGVPALAGGSSSVVRVSSDAAYSTDDWKGGSLYIKELNLFARIAGSNAPSGSGQNLDLTITGAYRQSALPESGGIFPPVGALLAGDPAGYTIFATPLGPDVLAAKFVSSTFDSISQVIADLAGGHAQIMRVVLAATNSYLLVTFNP